MGLSVGLPLGTRLGLILGREDGFPLGTALGVVLGAKLELGDADVLGAGLVVGLALGAFDALTLGALDLLGASLKVGLSVGSFDGKLEGVCESKRVGLAVVGLAVVGLAVVGLAVVGDGEMTMVETVNSRGLPGLPLKYGTAVMTTTSAGVERTSAASYPPAAFAAVKEYGRAKFVRRRLPLT